MLGLVEFDPYSRAFFEDPTEVYRWLRDEAPVYRSERYGFWALSRFDDVVRAHRDVATFSSTHGVSLDDLMRPGESWADNLIVMDPPEHDRMRSLVSRAFTPRAITAFEPLVRQVIASYLDKLHGRDAFDVVADFAAPFPVEVISAILGVPDGERQQIRHWTDAMLHREEGNPQPSREAMNSAMALGAYFFSLAQEKRAAPGEDMMSALLSHELTDVEVANFGVLLAAAGSETVTKLIGSGVVLFDRHPDQWQRVLDDEAVLPAAIEEILRYAPPCPVPGPVLVGGGGIRQRHHPRRRPRAADHRRGHPRCPRLRPPRRLRHHREQHLSISFGHGAHACIGAHLARLESRVAFEEIRRRWPSFTVDESGLRRVTMSNVAGYVNVPVIL